MLPKANPINKVVDKLRRVRIVDRQYQQVLQWVIGHKFFGTVISINKKLEKEIKIQCETVQLTDGAGQMVHTY